MDIELRAVTEDQMMDFVLAGETAFHDIPPKEESQWFANILEADRTIAAFDGSKIVGTAAAFTFDMSVPGGRAPTAGVTIVGVHATHRRRGITRQMMLKQLGDIHDAGEPLAALWASEGIIYQRFGYGLAAMDVNIDIPRIKGRFFEDNGPQGELSLVDRFEVIDDLLAIYEKVRDRRSGMMRRDENWLRNHSLVDPERHRDGGGPLFTVIAELGPDERGYAHYRMHHNWTNGSPQGHVDVSELMATSPKVERELWRYLFDIDLTASTKAWWQPLDSPLFLMLGEPRALKARSSDALWIRVIDVGTALQGRSYESGNDRLVFGVADPICDWNDGAWSFEVTDGRAQVTKTDDDPDLVMNVRDLAAAYLGGHSFSDLREALRVEEKTAGAIARADALFRTALKPWSPEIF